MSVLIKKKVIVFFVYLFVTCLLPLFITNAYYMDVLIKSTYFLTMAVSLSVLIGHLGMLSLAHPAFFGIGAYTSALLSTKLGLPVLVSMGLAGLATSLIAIMVAFPLMKLNYHSFAIGTLAFLIIMKLVVLNWIDLTRGPLCLSELNRPSLRLGELGFQFQTDLANYYFMLGIAILTIVLVFLIINSRYGRALNSIRNDESLAAAAGVDAYRYKIIAFGITAVFPALAGAFQAHYISVVCPKIFDFNYVIYLLIMVIIGGASSLTGVIVSSYLFTFLPELLRITTEYRDLVYGLLLTIFIIYMPNGIWPKLRMLVDIKKRYNTSGPSAS
jgi:branched-chain amino acid transport system permease protein